MSAERLKGFRSHPIILINRSFLVRQDSEFEMFRAWLQN